MSENTEFERFGNLELLIPERLDTFNRYVKDFVIVGFALTDGGGLNLLVGTVGADSVAYIDGFQVIQTGQKTETLTDNATNHVYVKFTKSPDPVAGPASITNSIEINTTGIDPVNALKLATVTTSGGAITAITRIDDNFLFNLDDARLGSDLEHRQFQSKEIVIHKGTAFPASPVSGQLFFRTDENALYVNDGTDWQKIQGAVAETFSFTVQQAGGVTIGEPLRIVANDTVEKADATSLAKSRVVGFASADAADTADVVVNMRRVVLVAQFLTGLTLSPNEKVYLSPTAGRLTNVAPSTVGQTITVVGTTSDVSGYVGTTDADSRAEIFFEPKEPILIN